MKADSSIGRKDIVHDQWLRIVTGQAVILKLREVNFMPRLVAALLDVVVYVAGWIGLLFGIARFSTDFALDAAATEAMSLLSIVLLMFIAPLLVEGISRGRSL